MMFFLSDEMPFSFDELLLFGAASGGKAIEDTATGNPLTFLTDLARPLKSLLIPFTPKQTGSGDPSPTNIRPIVPWNGLTVKRGGKNLFSSAVEQGGLTTATDGSAINPPSSKRVRTEDYILLGNGTYTISSSASAHVVICVYDENKTYLIDESLRSWASLPRTFTITGNRYIKCMFRKADENAEILPSYLENLQLEVGSSDTAYEPYKPITETDIPFASPVYGGTLDVVSGVLRVQWAGFSATWGDGESATDMGEGITRKVFPMVDYLQTGQANNMCNIAPYSANENASVHFYYSGSGATNRKCRLFLPSDTPDTTAVTVITKLSQTYEVQLTPAQITALVGNNTIWSDTDGTMTAVFFKKA